MQPDSGKSTNAIGTVTISSRTPEGLPFRCSICGEAAAIEASYPNGDACCPACGQLLWWFRDRYPSIDDDIERLNLDINLGSLDLVELVLELEEEFDISISDAEAEQITSVKDVLRYLRRRLTDDAA